MLVSSAEVDRSAAKAYQEAMQAAQSKKLLNSDAQQSERVRAIARRLIPVTAAFRADAPGSGTFCHMLPCSSSSRSSGRR